MNKVTKPIPYRQTPRPALKSRPRSLTGKQKHTIPAVPTHTHQATTLAAPSHSQPEILIERWKHGRFWAVYLQGELLTITVYKKGALALKDMILKSSGSPQGYC